MQRIEVNVFSHSFPLLILGVEGETENSGKGTEEMIAIKSRKSGRAFHSHILQRNNQRFIGEIFMQKER